MPSKYNSPLRDKIMDAFVSLLEKQPFSSIRVTAIVQESNVSQQSFYRLFQDKYDLAICFFSEQLATTITLCGRNGTIRDVMMTILTIVKNNSKLYSNLLCDEEGSRAFPDILSRLSSDWTGFPPAWATTIINTNIMTDWANNRFHTPIEEIYYRFLSSLPAYELLSERELEKRIKEYEKLKSTDFKSRKHGRIHK